MHVSNKFMLVFIAEVIRSHLIPDANTSDLKSRRFDQTQVRLNTGETRHR